MTPNIVSNAASEVDGLIQGLKEGAKGKKGRLQDQAIGCGTFFATSGDSWEDA